MVACMLQNLLCGILAFLDGTSNLGANRADVYLIGLRPCRRPLGEYAKLHGKVTIQLFQQFSIFPQTDLSVGVLAVLVVGRWSYLAAGRPSEPSELL